MTSSKEYALLESKMHLFLPYALGDWGLSTLSVARTFVKLGQLR